MAESVIGQKQESFIGPKSVAEKQKSLSVLSGQSRERFGPFFTTPEKKLNLEYLWGNVVRCAAERGGGHPVLDALLAHAEVGNLDVPLCVEHNVVQLQVPEGKNKEG